MSGLVERVARAISECDGPHWETFSPGIREEFYARARAAIVAMREPTEALLDAGDESYLNGGYAVDIWGAMIDVASGK